MRLWDGKVRRRTGEKPPKGVPTFKSKVKHGKVKHGEFMYDVDYIQFLKVDVILFNINNTHTINIEI